MLICKSKLGLILKVLCFLPLASFFRLPGFALVLNPSLLAFEPFTFYRGLPLLLGAFGLLALAFRLALARRTYHRIVVMTVPTITRPTAVISKAAMGVAFGAASGAVLPTTARSTARPTTATRSACGTATA